MLWMSLWRWERTTSDCGRLGKHSVISLRRTNSWKRVIYLHLTGLSGTLADEKLTYKKIKHKHHFFHNTAHLPWYDIGSCCLQMIVQSWLKMFLMTWVILWLLLLLLYLSCEISQCLLDGSLVVHWLNIYCRLFNSHPITICHHPANDLVKVEKSIRGFYCSKQKLLLFSLAGRELSLWSFIFSTKQRCKSDFFLCMFKINMIKATL